MQTQRVLRIEVERDHAAAAGGQHGSEIGGEGGFTDPAFGGHDRDDFHERRGPLTSHELEGAGAAALGSAAGAAAVCAGVPRRRSKTDCSGADSLGGRGGLRRRRFGCRGEQFAEDRRGRLRRCGRSRVGGRGCLCPCWSVRLGGGLRPCRDRTPALAPTSARMRRSAPAQWRAA